MSITDKLFAHYETGKTTIFASTYDNRFAYCLYVPKRLSELNLSETTLLISVHGTGRMQELYRDLFCEFAEYHNCIVLSPLFPANILGNGNMSGYKYIKEDDIRYDEVILGMANEVAEKYGINVDQFLMFGFSGGGHFTHRFTILHPDRIKACSIGSPGSVTLLDPDKDWWVGVRDCEQHLGIKVDTSKFEGKPVHLVVGGADTETWEITHQPGDRYYMDGANSAGKNRPERMATLANSFSEHGAKVRSDIVDGETHDVVPISVKTREFFHDVLTGNYK